MLEIINPSIISAIIIGSSIISACVYILFIATRIQREMRMNREAQAAISERQFHSTIGKERDAVERELYRLNRELSDTRSEFKEVYHLALSAQKEASKDQHSTSTFRKTFGIEDRSVEEGYVFVLTPFSETEKSTYSALVSFFQSHGRRVARGDETAASGDIFRHIIKQIASAEIVIANLNGRNANVMYELGIAQALDKHVIIIANVKEKVPFDLQSQRTILYKNEEELTDGLTRSILSKSTRQ